MQPARGIQTLQDDHQSKIQYNGDGCQSAVHMESPMMGFVVPFPVTVWSAMVFPLMMPLGVLRLIIFSHALPNNRFHDRRVNPEIYYTIFFTY